MLLLSTGNLMRANDATNTDESKVESEKKAVSTQLSALSKGKGKNSCVSVGTGFFLSVGLKNYLHFNRKTNHLMQLKINEKIDASTHSTGSQIVLFSLKVCFSGRDYYSQVL